MKFVLDGRQTDRLMLRSIQQTDFNQWLEFFKDDETSRHWVEEKETPNLACENWYKKQFWRYENDMGGMNALVEKESGKLIGHCGLLVQTVDGITELEIGYSLLRAFWNKGYATEAATHCRDYAFQNNFSDSLISIISKTNVPSLKVAGRLGMRVEKETVYKNNAVFILRIDKDLRPLV